MAVAFDAAMTAGNATDTQTASATTSISSTGMTIGGSANLLVVLVLWSGSVTSRAFTWNSVSMTEAVYINGASSTAAGIYYLANPATGNKTLAGSWTTSRDCYMGCVSFTGADTTTPIVGADTVSGNTGTTVTVTSTTDGATAAVWGTNGSTPTVNFNKVWDESSLNPGGAGSYQLAGTSNGHTFTGAGGTSPAWAGVHVQAAAAGGTTVTPGVLALTTATFAPQSNMKINAASPTALSLSTFAPAARLGTVVTPGVLAHTLTTFAPQVNLQINGASPTALTLTTFAPDAALGPLTVTPDVLSLTLTTFAPDVTVSADLTVTPGVATLSLSTFAPQLQEVTTPGVLALSLSTFAPDVSQTILVTPGTATLALTAYAPQLKETLTPALVALTLAAFAPTLDFRINGASPTGLVIAAFAPQLQEVVTPSVRSLALTFYVPVITNSGVVLVPVSIPMTGSLTPIAMSGSMLAAMTGSYGLDPLTGSVGD